MWRQQGTAKQFGPKDSVHYMETLVGTGKINSTPTTRTNNSQAYPKGRPQQPWA